MFETGKIKKLDDYCNPLFYLEALVAIELDGREEEIRKVCQEADEEMKELYRQALEDVQAYLTSVLTREISEKGCTGAGVSLILPLGDMHIHVGREMSGVLEGGQPAAENNEPDLIYTPIGRMDLYTYTAVINDKDNPVRMLYELMHKTIECMQIMFKGVFLSKEVLGQDGFKVHDPLNLYKYERLWLHLDGFLRGEIPHIE